MTTIPEIVSVGRVSVDMYAAEVGVGFDGQQTFSKSVGGSPTNVAVAAARLGHRAAIVTKVGDDGFGTYVRRRLEGWGVGTDFVLTQPGGRPRSPSRRWIRPRRRRSRSTADPLPPTPPSSRPTSRTRSCVTAACCG